MDSRSMRRLNRRDVSKHFPAKPALLVVDMQNYFVHADAGAYLSGSAKALENSRLLIQLFRRRRLPVAFTRHAHESLASAGILRDWWRESVMDGTWESELAEELSPRRGEPVLRKERYSGFLGTELEGWLRRKKCDGLVIAGVMTHLCVETTARDAFMRDLAVVIAGDACASDSEDHHSGSLRNLAHGFALVMPTRDILEAI